MSYNKNKTVVYMDREKSNRDNPRAIPLGLVEGQEVVITSTGPRNTTTQVYRHKNAMNIVYSQIKKNKAMDRLRFKLIQKQIEKATQEGVDTVVYVV